MKKIITSTLIASSMFSMLNASEISQKYLNHLKALPSLSMFNIKEAEDLGNLYHFKAIAKRGRITPLNVFLTKDEKYLIIGNGFNTKDKTKLEFEVDMKQYKKDAAFTYGTGKDEYYVFTDPECPFCHRFEKLMQRLGDKATFHVYLFPLRMHKEAKGMSLHVLSQPKDKRASALYEMMIKHSKEYKNTKPSEEAKKALQKQMQIAQELSVTGTPSLFDANGNKIGDWNKLKAKYNLPLETVDTRALGYLKSNNIPIALSSSGKKDDLFVFIDIEKDKSFIKGKKFKSLLSTYNINLIIDIKDSKTAIAKALLIQNSKNKKDGFYKYIDKDLTKKDQDKAKDLLKNPAVSKPVMTATYIISQIGIKNTPLIVDAKGKVIK